MSFDLSIKNGDIKINSDGALGTVGGNLKLKQDIIKIILTNLGENKFHPNYGSQAGSLKIGYYADDKLVALDIESSVKRSIKNLMSLQRSQSQRQSLSPGEVIIDVLNVTAGRDEADPRMYNIIISVLTQELTEVSEFLSVRIA